MQLSYKKRRFVACSHSKDRQFFAFLERKAKMTCRVMNEWEIEEQSGHQKEHSMKAEMKMKRKKQKKLKKKKKRMMMMKRKLMKTMMRPM